MYEKYFMQILPKDNWCGHTTGEENIIMKRLIQQIDIIFLTFYVGNCIV